jgi:hypothetical protein
MWKMQSLYYGRRLPAVVIGSMRSAMQGKAILLTSIPRRALKDFGASAFDVVLSSFKHPIPRLGEGSLPRGLAPSTPHARTGSSFDTHSAIARQTW